MNSKDIEKKFSGSQLESKIRTLTSKYWIVEYVGTQRSFSTGNWYLDHNGAGMRPSDSKYGLMIKSDREYDYDIYTTPQSCIVVQSGTFSGGSMSGERTYIYYVVEKNSDGTWSTRGTYHI